jgi:DNA-binding transcriptional regulator YdaS (Cro superfamily)
LQSAADRLQQVFAAGVLQWLTHRKRQTAQAALTSEARTSGQIETDALYGLRIVVFVKAGGN